MNKLRKIILMLDSSRAADRGIIRGIMEYAHLRGNWSFYRYKPRFRSPPFTPRQSENILERLQTFDADGIVGYIPAEEKLIDSIFAKKFPAVSLPIQKPIKGLINIQQDKNVGIKGAEYFLERGFKHFAFCGTNDYWSSVRQEGFVARLDSVGFTPHLYPIVNESHKKNPGLNSMTYWLKKLPKPIAIMASNDERSAELVEACQSVNIQIPEQAAILGVDNDEMICRLSNPPLSSIELNFENTGYHAAKVLDDLISNRKVDNPEIRFYPIGVITRRSTDILSIEDEHVASAIRFIRSNARRNIHVQDVVNNSTLSIRALQQRFKKSLGKGIHQEIRHIRIQQFADMLLKTNLTVYQIAHELEIDDINHVSRVFKREMGSTPLEYRKKASPSTAVSSSTSADVLRYTHS